MKAINYIYILIFISFSFATANAVTIPQPWHRTTEASIGCEGGRCLAEAPRSNLQNFCEDLKSRARWAQDWDCHNVGIFDDGNDREILYELRRKPVASLTAEERAILQAADRYGNIGFCGAAGGNATLIMHNGRPAVVTSAHMVIDASTKKYRCTEEEMGRGRFAPNVSYYDHSTPDRDKDFTLRMVGVEFPPVEMERRTLGSGFHPGDDFVIFYLKEDVTKDVMPAGHTRGAMSIASSTQRSGTVYMLGVAPDIRQGMAVVNQTCAFQRMAGTNSFKHTCDSVRGSSGSLMSVMQDDELVLYGINTGGYEDPTPRPLPSNHFEWNQGTELPGNANF